ncbi:aryl-sulfate sulfotransferase N-terminal domain-containing protein [Collinsella sp. AF05-8-2]|uniref:aryl-sulfate sulfotransferase N-terminal domain-containing protein n=1 Tax=unclassified Collinsella TaxID=2637548 RepID=UPI0035173369
MPSTLQATTTKLPRLSSRSLWYRHPEVLRAFCNDRPRSRHLRGRRSQKNRRYAQSRRLFRTPHGGDTPVTEHEFKVIGLIPNRKNTVTLTCIAQNGTSRTSKFTVKTPTLKGEEEEQLAVTAGGPTRRSPMPPPRVAAIWFNVRNI